jgi:pimeloyl-ACP methyl ester carboxylesterase
MQFLSRHGVRLAYDEAGTGDPPILLVHGMRCDHRHMAPLFAHLRSRHRVVTVDLRGHGASDAPPHGYRNDELADDLLWSMEQLGAVQPVAIGHSFGGSLCLWIAATMPERLSGLVLLDSGVRAPEEKAAEMGGVIDDTSTPVAPSFFADRLFGPDDDPVVKAQILDVMDSSVPPPVVESLARTVLDFDSAAAAIACTLPALFVLADRPFSSAVMIARLGPNWRVGRVIGAGHFVQLFATAQVTAMIDRYLELLPPPGTASRRDVRSGA